MSTSLPLDWAQIDTVLLDMDGTLLDLHFDSYFWLEHVPRRYAEIHDADPQQSKQWLHQRIMRDKGTLNWYCVDYWSEQLTLDIAALKQEISHKVAYRPNAEAFLQALQQQGIRTVLVTNAHWAGLQLKLDKTGLGNYLDNIVVSHDLQAAKEEQAFWHRLQEQEPFDPARTLFIDDSPGVLASAKAYGIRHLLAIVSPDSQREIPVPENFTGLDCFSQILPKKSD